MPLSPDQMAYLSNQVNPQEYAKLLREQQIGNGILQQAAQPMEGQMVSGHYVAPSAIARIANIATAYLGNKMATDASGKVANAQASGFRDAFNSVYGQPQTAQTTAPVQPGYDNQVNQIDPKAPWMAGNVNPKPYSFNPRMAGGLMMLGGGNG